MDDLEGLAHYDSIMIKCGSDKLTRVYNKWREEFELVQIYYVRGSSIPSFISIWLQREHLRPVDVTDTQLPRLQARERDRACRFQTAALA